MKTVKVEHTHADCAHARNIILLPQLLLINGAFRTFESERRSYVCQDRQTDRQFAVRLRFRLLKFLLTEVLPKPTTNTLSWGCLFV